MAKALDGPWAALAPAFAVLALLSVPLTEATAIESSGDKSEDYEKAEKAIEAGEFEGATEFLQKVLEDDPDDADAYNLLAYSQRNLGHADVAMENYTRALELDPEHKGALEYQGELYLQLGDKAAAEANLAKLEGLCPWGCEERNELQAAIERFKDGDLTWVAPRRAMPASE